MKHIPYDQKTRRSKITECVMQCVAILILFGGSGFMMVAELVNCAKNGWTIGIIAFSILSVSWIGATIGILAFEINDIVKELKNKEGQK